MKRKISTRTKETWGWNTSEKQNNKTKISDRKTGPHGSQKNTVP